MEEINKASKLKAELDLLRPLDKEAEAQVLQKFRLDWNFHSNNIEGNALTFGETKALILHGITAQGKPLKDHFEIAGHDEAIKWVLDIVKDERSLSENFIRELHKLILKESYEVDAITSDGKPTKKRIHIGEYKKTPNHVKTKTGEIFRFSSPEETPIKMSELIAWYRAKETDPSINPIILAAEFHYRFIRIHPFDDGNGRTTRILMNFILLKFGYPPVIIRTENKEEYFSMLQLADSGDIEPFFNYIARNLNDSLVLMIKAARGESYEEDDDIDKEVALLERKLKNLGNPIGTTRSLDAKQWSFDALVEPLIKKYIQKGSLLDKFYVNNEMELSKDGGRTTYSKAEIIDKARTSLTGDHLKFTYYYEGFNQEGFEGTNYRSWIYIDFELTKIVIKGRYKEKSYNVLYGETLSDQRLLEIVAEEIRGHNLAIEAIITRKP
jgi:Fic family protein